MNYGLASIDVAPMTNSMRYPKLIRWTPTLANTRALSLRQPWAWLVVNGLKDVENRSWRTNHRGPLLIHASRTIEKQAVDNMRPYCQAKLGINLDEQLLTGGIIGVVEVTDCLRKHLSTWYVAGNWAWVLKNPRRLPFRECKAVVGFFTPDFKKEGEPLRGQS